MYIYVYILICIYICIHTYIYIYVHIYLSFILQMKAAWCFRSMEVVLRGWPSLFVSHWAPRSSLLPPSSRWFSLSPCLSPSLPLPHSLSTPLAPSLLRVFSLSLSFHPRCITEYILHKHTQSHIHTHTSSSWCMHCWQRPFSQC